MSVLPSKFNGRPVVQSALHATDESEKPYYGTIVIDHGNDIRTVTDVFSSDGQTWDAKNGVHRVPADSAERVFIGRLKRRSRFTEMVMERKCTWLAVAMMRWNYLPVSGRDEFTIYARYAAGEARNFEEFYRPENRKTAEAIERWLTRYSAEHTHPDLRQ